MLTYVINFVSLLLKIETIDMKNNSERMGRETDKFQLRCL